MTVISEVNSNYLMGLLKFLSNVVPIVGHSKQSVSNDDCRLFVTINPVK
jgi:hypothetical protein